MKTLLVLFVLLNAAACLLAQSCPPTPLPFIDNFDSPSLDSCWFWVREDASHWSLTERPGWMRLESNGNIHQPQSNSMRNILLRVLPSLDLLIETKLDFTPGPTVGAGLMFYKDDDNFVDIMRIPVSQGSDDGIRSHSHVDNVGQNTEILESWNPVFLRILKVNDAYSCWASPDSLTWSVVGQWNNDLTANGEIRCGLYAQDADQNFYIDQDFDYFLAVGYTSSGYLSLLSPGPPDWDYHLNWISGAISQFKFTDFCPGTLGSVSGAAAAVGWTAANYSDSIVFSSTVPLTTGSIETFTLSHPWCSDRITWTVGDSSGEIDGPLPVELLSFTAIPTEDAIRLSFSTASETDNDRFEILRGEQSDGVFARIAVLPSQGNSAAEQRYEYTDTDVNPGQTYWYYLADVDMSGNRSEHREMMVSATALDALAVPSSYSLSVYPNPFNPRTTISFSLLEAGLTRIAVYDVAGRWIRTLTDEERSAGNHRVAFDAPDLPSGVYFVRMESGEFRATRKVVLMR